MESLLKISELVVAIVIIALVLLQEGGGLSSAFGGRSESFHVRRGLEKLIFKGTIIAIIIFIGLSIANLVL